MKQNPKAVEREQVAFPCGISVLKRHSYDDVHAVSSTVGLASAYPGNAEGQRIGDVTGAKL